MAYDTLAEIDTLMFKINKYIPLNLQPQNEEEEKQKFFRSTTYSPFFRYSPPIPQLDYLLSVLNKLNINTHQVWGFLLDEKRKEFIDKIHLIKATGTHAFS